MKNFAKIIVTLLLATLLCLGLFACGKDSFSVSDDFKDKNNSTSATLGGFVAETDDFYYVINGVGTSTDSNAFGDATQKGSLVAVKKSDLTKTAVVVPKLFVASDYNAGIYVIDGYVYYATPSVAKTMSGSAKNTDLTFAKTKLDGTDYVEFATISGLSSEYRYYKANDVVYLVYYDTENTKLVSYNTLSKTATDICVTDEEADESLDAYKFFDNSGLANGIVAYTTKVYKGEYIEDTERSTENYNKLYVYKAGVEKAECVKDGSKVTLKDENYTIKAVVDGKLVYSVTTTLDTTGKVYEGDKVLANSTIYDATYIKDGDVVYTYDSDNTAIVKNNGSDKTIVAKASDVSTLLFKNGDYFYYVSSDNKLARVKAGAEYVAYLSEDTVSTSWFNPVLNKAGDTIFYCDNSTAGASNIKYLVITAEGISAEEEAIADEENYTFEGQKFVVDNRTEDEITSAVDTAMDSLADYLDDNSRITLGKDDKDSTEYHVIVVRAEYDKLSDESKEEIEGCYTTLCKYEKAIELSKICEELAGIELKMTDDAKDDTTLKATFDEAKAIFTSLEEEGQDYITSICNLMAGNSYYYYYYAKTNVFID